MKHLFVLMALLLMMAPALAQPQPPDLQRQEERAYLRDQGAQWQGERERPRWCRDYDRRDYWRERRECGDDWRCRKYINRKAERCGLRG